MEDTRAEALPIGAAEAAAALQTLQRYKAGKAALDKRLIDNELWFRMGHWKNYRDPLMPGKAQPSSGWLFNSIANKHADAMDNYPEPMVLPRAADDQATAQALSSVLPVVLEQADYEQVYSDVWWRKLKQGTGVTGIFWDPAARGGLGDIAVRSVNLLMLYWEPGVAVGLAQGGIHLRTQQVRVQRIKGRRCQQRLVILHRLLPRTVCAHGIKRPVCRAGGLAAAELPAPQPGAVALVRR